MFDGTRNGEYILIIFFFAFFYSQNVFKGLRIKIDLNNDLVQSRFSSILHWFLKTLVDLKIQIVLIVNQE